VAGLRYPGKKSTQIVYLLAIFKLIDPTLGEWVETKTEALVKANASMEEIPGVVQGGKDNNAVPPTLPAPNTGVVSDIFEQIRAKFGGK
jgi:hypothetical protein